MDFLLPDDETIKLMNAEYAKTRAKNASIFAYDAQADESASEGGRTSFIQIVLLFLYITKFLRYNVKYGTEIYDSHGSVGRVQPDASPFGIVNNLK